MVKQNQKVVARTTHELPGAVLSNAQYKDVIERNLIDGNSAEEKLTWCVSSEVEMRKCKALKDAAYSRDIRPAFECVIKGKSECQQALARKEVDIMVVAEDDFLSFNHADSQPILFEALDENDVLVVVTGADAKTDVLKKGSLKFDESDQRSQNAALLFNDKRGKKVCPDALHSDANGQLQVVNAKTLDLQAQDKVLVCKDFSKRPLREFKTCNFDYTITAAVVGHKMASTNKIGNIKHAFTALSEKFGHGGKIEDVFELFGEFEAGQKNVLFDVS